jgi:hypothetical protein
MNLVNISIILLIVILTGIILFLNYKIGILKIGINSYKRLSPVDYERKDKLYHFYRDIFGFEIVKEVTKQKWGFFKKELS